MRLRISAIAVAIAAALPSISSAVDFSFSGFSTSAYAEVDEEGVAFKSSSNIDGIDSSGTFEYDSILGLQGTLRFGEQWSVTAQGLVRQQPDGDIGANIDWAYVKWEPIANLAIRAGLTRPPTFMYSDSVFLGYANTWARPPMDVYGISPVYVLQGIDAIWRHQIGPVRLTVQPYAGTSVLEQPTQIDGRVDEIDVKDWYGVAVTGEYGSLTGRIGYGDKEYEDELSSLVVLKTSLARAGYPQLAKDIGLEGNKSPILNVGLQYDNSSQFVIAEYAHRGSKSISVAELSGAYLTVGGRFGGFTPYATVGRLRVDSPRSSNVIQTNSSMPIVQRLTLTALDGYVDALASLISDQDSYSAGVRYEMPSFSVLNGLVVKAQIDHLEAQDGGRGFIGTTPANFDGTANVYTLSVDLVF
jgi:hypothetical protein